MLGRASSSQFNRFILTGRFCGLAHDSTKSVACRASGFAHGASRCRPAGGAIEAQCAMPTGHGRVHLAPTVSDSSKRRTDTREKRAPPSAHLEPAQWRYGKVQSKQQEKRLPGRPVDDDKSPNERNK